MLAAYGCGWYSSLNECSEDFTQVEKTYEPIIENVEKYKELYSLYKSIYQQTKELNQRLNGFRP